MGGDIRRKEKIEKAMEFVKRMKKVQEEAGSSIKEGIGGHEKAGR